MALTNQVEDSLKEAEGCLRNALHWSAKNEKPFVNSAISDMIYKIDTLMKTEEMLDFLEQSKNNKFKDFLN